MGIRMMLRVIYKLYKYIYIHVYIFFFNREVGIDPPTDRIVPDREGGRMGGGDCLLSIYHRKNLELR